MECEYARYGCSSKFANNDHQQLHGQALTHQHLKLVVQFVEKEVEKNKVLTSTLENLEGRLAHAEKKAKASEQLEDKLKEFEAKLVQLQGLIEKNGTAVKQNGNGTIPSDAVEVKSKDDSQSRSASAPPSKWSYPKQERDSISKYDLKPYSSRSSTQEKDDAPKNSKSDEEVRAVLKGDVEVVKREDRPMLSGTPPPQTPPPFIVKTSAGDIEPSERRHTSSALREESRSRSRTLPTNPSKKENPLAIIPADTPIENGIVWEYDSVADEWCRGVVSFRLAKQQFAEGTLRNAHMLEINGDPNSAEAFPLDKAVKSKNIRNDALPTLGLLGDKYVAKISKTRVAVDRYFEDVKMQMVCVDLGKKFNQQGTPKKVEFLTAWVLEIPKPTGSIWAGLEHYIGGDFKKQNNNNGSVLETRNTPQAFSHFTWEETKNTLIVVDLQGVDDDYTDPQIHTTNGQGYGAGNLGKTGIDKFMKTHQCNAICHLLNLPRVNSENNRNAIQKIVKGTQQVPFIDDQLGIQVFPHLDMPDDYTTGEFQCIQSLTGHTDRIVSLCIGPKHLFSGSSDGTLRVWSLQNMTYERELNVHRKSVEAICANDKYLITGSADHNIKVWDIANFALHQSFRDHVGEVNALVLTDKSLNYFVSASFDKNIKVWSLRTLKCVQTLSGHSKCVKTLATSGTILFSGSNDGSIFMWSLKTMQCLFGFDAHEGWVKSIVLKDKTLYTGSHDNIIKEWNVTNLQYGEKIAEHKERVNSLCLTDKYLISGSDDKTAQIMDTNTKQIVAVLKGHRLGVQAVVTDGKHVFTGSDDCTIKIWKWAAAEK